MPTLTIANYNNGEYDPKLYNILCKAVHNRPLTHFTHNIEHSCNKLGGDGRAGFRTPLYPGPSFSFYEVEELIMHLDNEILDNKEIEVG